MCQVLMDGWKLHDVVDVVITKLHNSWKWVVLVELQLNCNELHRIYDELQLYNSCNLFNSIHNVKIQWIASGHYNSKTELQG